MHIERSTLPTCDKYKHVVWINTLFPPQKKIEVYDKYSTEDLYKLVHECWSRCHEKNGRKVPWGPGFSGNLKEMNKSIQAFSDI